MLCARMTTLCRSKTLTTTTTLWRLTSPMTDKETTMYDYYDDYYREPAGLDPWDDMWFEEPEEDEEESEPEMREDFGFFGVMGLRD